MITVQPETNSVFNTCESCLTKGVMFTVTVTGVLKPGPTNSLTFRLCADCKDELGRECNRAPYHEEHVATVANGKRTVTTFRFYPERSTKRRDY